MYQLDTQGVGRLIIANAPEWGIQPERYALPGNNSAVYGQPFPDDEMAFFWSGDNKHVITRHDLDVSHANYCCEILGYRRTTHAAPTASDPDSSICAALLEPGRLRDLGSLLDETGPGPLVVESYGATPQYLDLVEALRAHTRRTIRDAMTQRQDLGIVSRLDSKIRAREFLFTAAAVKSVRLTRAFSAQAGPQLRRDVEAAVRTFGSVLLKAEFAAGGHGMAVVDSLAAIDEQAADLLAQACPGDLLLEEYLGPDDATTPVSFSARIDPDGALTSVGVGRELRYLTRFYAGMHIGRHSIDQEYADAATRAGLAIGSVMSRWGFRGAFNLDFLCRLDDGMLFPLEVNPRRSLGSTLVDICEQLYGPHYALERAAIARRHVPVHRSISGWGQLRDFLDGRKLLGNYGEFVVLPYMVNTLPAQAYIGVAVTGRDNAVIADVLQEVMAQLAEGESHHNRRGRPESRSRAEKSRA
jgi:hypothetical protein